MGDYAEQMVKNCAIVQAFPPIDTTGAIQTGTVISLKHHDHVTIIINQGAWAAGTPAVTLTQDTSCVGAPAVKALGFTHMYTNTAAPGSNVFVDTAVVANTFNLTAVANVTTVIEVDADTLDATNGFDCMNVVIASPGANADLISGTYILSKSRYAGAAAAMRDVTID